MLAVVTYTGIGYLETLVRSMPGQVKVVIKINGDYTP